MSARPRNGHCGWRHGATTFSSGREAREGELEAHLVVALAGGSVADRVGALGVRDFDLALGDHRARDRSAEQVVAFVDGVGAHHRKDEVARELFAQVFEIELARAGRQRLLLEPGGFLGLADIGAVRHHFAAVEIAHPAQDDRGVEPARIREHQFFYLSGRHAAILRHSRPRLKWCRARRRCRLSPGAAATPSRPFARGGGFQPDRAPASADRRAPRR